MDNQISDEQQSEAPRVKYQVPDHLRRYEKQFKTEADQSVAERFEQNAFPHQNLNNLEKKIINSHFRANNRQVMQKREDEEMSRQKQAWGLNRSRMEGDILRKLEMKNWYFLVKKWWNLQPSQARRPNWRNWVQTADNWLQHWAQLVQNRLRVQLK